MTTLDLDTLHLDPGSHRTPDEGMCVIWEGRRDENGYGLKGRRRAATVSRITRRVWRQEVI